jgi:hypothetical protein
VLYNKKLTVTMAFRTKLQKEVAIAIKLLNTAVISVGNPNITLRINIYAVSSIKFTVFGTF